MFIEPVESLTPGAYLSMARAIQSDPPPELRPIRMGLLSSNSFSFLEPYLVVECARRGMLVKPSSAAFGQIEQALLDDTAGVVSSATGVVVLALRIEDMFADAFSRFGALRPAAQQCLDRLEQCVDLVRSVSEAPILVANFSVPSSAISADIFGAGCEAGPSQLVAAANAELASRLSERANVDIWDYAGLVAARGAAAWTDLRMWYLARQPIAGVNLPYAAAHLARTVSGLMFERAKCLVLDLDNTLWGGAAGDDGIEGILIGDDHPGNAFKSFQRALAGLSDRGVLLAIASKNDADVVRDIFERHPDLVLRWDDFSAHRINWEPKSASIRAIADELNIGIDALAFFDDNPVEREEVRQNLPEVSVIEVPASPLGFVEALYADGLFDAPLRSAEDAERVSYYRNEARRRAAQETASSMDAFLASLEMRATTGSLGPETLARVAQLVGKTNQFNLTTRRHSQSRLQEMAADDRWEVRWTRLGDRYGESGLIGVAIVHFEDDVATLDSFLMSCRVMNRRVEQAMLRDVIDIAIARGCGSLRGEYVATDRNSIVSGFYAEQGFAAAGGGAVFELDLAKDGELPGWPAVIERAS